MQGRSDPGADAGATPVAALILTVLLPFGLGYYLSYLYRTINAVIAPELVTELGLSAADLGFMTSLYFITFAVVQVPLGIALDRHGPRRVQAALLVVAALGGACFAVGQSFATLSAGRACIGLGVAGCFMAAIKANALWWPAARLPLVNNVTAAFGGFGALSATVPVEAALSMLGWRGIFAAVALLTVALAAVIWFVVPERPGGGVVGTGLRDEARQIGASCRDGFFWRIGLMLVICMSVYLSYQTLWAGPWLRDVAGFDRAAVARHLLLIQLGMLAGVLLSGLATDRLRRIGIAPIDVLRVGVAIYLLVQLVLVLDVVRLAAVLWAGFGFFGATMFLCYAIYAQHYPTALFGRVTTINNMVLFLLAFAVQWGVGAIIDLWPEPAAARYDPAAHRAALAVMLALQAAAFGWFVWPRKLDKPGGEMS